jgi:hypothetical protein
MQTEGGLLFRVPLCISHTVRPTHTQYISSDTAISPSQRPLPTKHTTEETDIHAVSGIRTNDTGNHATADLRLGLPMSVVA